jgi:hypothetical protein
MLGHKMFQTLRAHYPETGCTIFGSLSDSFIAGLIFCNPVQFWKM